MKLYYHLGGKFIYEKPYFYEYYDYEFIGYKEFFCHCGCSQWYKKSIYHKKLYKIWTRDKKYIPIYISYEYRKDPVPRTGKRIRGCYKYYRHPRTTQERIWNEAHYEFVRGKRKPYRLINSWNDILRSDCKIYSWKKQKIKKQWMKNLK